MPGHGAPVRRAAERSRHEAAAHEPQRGRLANDRALYSCQCGYVFESPVSTSVVCPHCGDTQAW